MDCGDKQSECVLEVKGKKETPSPHPSPQHISSKTVQIHEMFVLSLSVLIRKGRHVFLG